MKLRNKRTGQEGDFIINRDHFECTDLEYVPEYRSLAELSEEWEDYDEKAEEEFVAMLKQLSEAIDRMTANITGICGKGKK